MTNNSMNHSRAKHINIAYHYVKHKMIEEKIIDILYILIKDMIVDELIKSLKASKFLISRKLMRLFKESYNQSDE